MMIYLSRREAAAMAERRANFYGKTFVLIRDKTYDTWMAEPAEQFESIRRHWEEKYTADLEIVTHYYPADVEVEELRIPL